MFQKFYPTQWVDSAYEVDYEQLYENGVRGLIYDVDNTLVMHGAPADARAIALFRRLHELGFTTCILSNNKDPRVRPFADAVSSLYICEAHKPSRKNYARAMRMMDTDDKNTYFIGDQLFTDIYGANRAGIPTILVHPIDKKEEIQIILKRRLEWIVLAFYRRKIRRDMKNNGCKD